jgi:hypothetical protein
VRQSCGRCPALQAEVGRLHGHVAQLERQLDYVRRLFGNLLGAVRATVAFIDREQTEPTMPRRNVIPAIAARLTYAVDLAEGKRP